MWKHLQIGICRSNERVALIAAAVAVLIACSGQREAPAAAPDLSEAELKAERIGRVVDANTGQGLPDVTVIANWRFASQGPDGYSIGCVLQKATTTDRDGNFVLPDVSKDLDLSRSGAHRWGVPGFEYERSTAFGMGITAYKQGYLRPGDLTKLREMGESSDIHLSIMEKVPHTKDHGRLKLEPIGLERQELLPRDQIIYADWLLRLNTCHESKDMTQPEYHRMGESLKQAVRELPCSMGDTMFSRKMLSSYLGAVSDQSLIVRLRALAQRELQRESWPDQPISAKALCELLHPKDETP